MKEWKNYLAFGVTEDNRLCDGECIVQVTQGVELPFLAFHSYKYKYQSVN